MNDIELLQRVSLAAAIGLLIGIERGWQTRQMRNGGRVAGIRTYTLIAAMGGICALLPGDATLGLGLAGFALPFGFFEWRRARLANNRSATDFIAGLLTFILGAYAVRGSIVVAGAAGVLTAAVLAERKVLHSFLLRLKWTELRAALVLLVMTAVLLPVLPNRTVDPWGALNPHQIWLMTILVGAVCYAGYIAVRVASERRGLLFAGLMGGLASSTTVTWTFARLVRRDAGSLPPVMAAILAAWIISLLRMSALAVAVAPDLLAALARPMAAASLTLLVPAAVAYRFAAKSRAQELQLQDPFDLPLLLRFAALFAAILLAARLFGNQPADFFVLAGVSGLLDVDPITLSMAKLSATGVAQSVAVLAILIAAAANILAKSVLATAFGGTRLGLSLGASGLLACGAGGLVHFSAI